MGGGTYDRDNYTYVTKSAASSISSGRHFASSASPDLLPSGWKDGIRESLDAVEGTAAVPIMLALDVTGSMSMFPKYFVSTGLGEVLDAIYNLKTIQNPQIALAGIGDSYCDNAPFQMTQFETDPVKLVEAAKSLWLEGGGGGNNFESYSLALYAALRIKTSAASRGEKGFIFIIGDDNPDPTYPASKDICRTSLDTTFPEALPIEVSSLLNMVKENWHVVFIDVSKCTSGYGTVMGTWTKFLGSESVIECADKSALGAIVSSVINARNGAAYADIIAQYSGAERTSVEKALAVIGGAVSTTTQTTAGSVRL